MGQLLENDLVPLSEAASLAYLDLAGVKGEAGSEEHLRDVVDLAVVALLHVAPIYQSSADGSSSTTVMSADQGEALLFAPIRQGREAPALDRFYIRRSDLRGAITHLRNAGGLLRRS